MQNAGQHLEYRAGCDASDYDLLPLAPIR